MLRYRWFEKNYLYSEERYLGLDFFPRETEFFQFKESQNFIDAWNLDSFGGLAFQVSLDTKLHNRKIYSGLDFLGEVGGLLSFLLTVGTWFISLMNVFSASFLERHVIQKVFRKLDKRSKLPSKPYQSKNGNQIDCKVKSLTKRRRSFIQNVAENLENPYKKALRRVQKELDIVNFIKKQIKVNIILETIFSKTERILVNKNKRFELNQSVSEESDIADLSASTTQ